MVVAHRSQQRHGHQIEQRRRRVDRIGSGHVEKTADRRTGNPGQLEGAGIHCGRFGQHGVGHQPRHHGLPGRKGQGPADADYEYQRQNHMLVQPAGEAAQGQQDDREQFQRLACRDDAPAIELIGDVAGRQCQQQCRDELHQTDETEVEGVAAQCVDLPANGHREHLEAEPGAQARTPESHECWIVPRRSRGRRCSAVGHEGESEW